MKTFTIDAIVDAFRRRGHGLYSGEAVSQLDHALQCATLAQNDAADPPLVVAALLHDICHLLEDKSDASYPHERLAAEMLSPLFGAAVIEPIRLHVAAKRYLCATDPAYWISLSEMSRHSLVWQGGPFTPREAAAFITQDFAADALRLRRWDDAAKVNGATTASLDHFIGIMRAVSVKPKVLERAGA
ncbi:HD domain-containing protein [soil metagenome]